MKSKLLIILGLFFFSSYVFAQWQQVDEPELRTSTVFDYLYTGESLFANCGFSFWKYDDTEDKWEYSGDGLYDQAYYHMFQDIIMFDGQVYTRYGNSLKYFKETTQLWQQVDMTLPSGLPPNFDVYEIGSFNDMFYMILLWNVFGSTGGRIYTTTDFQIWTECAEVDESVYNKQTLDGPKDWLWIASQDGSVQYSSDAITFSDLNFGTIPMHNNPWAVKERVDADNEDAYLYYEGPSSKLYRYNTDSEIWDTISNNFPPATQYIDYEAADGLISALTISGASIQSLYSNDAGDTWQTIGGGMGAIPQISNLTKIDDQTYICSNLLGEVLISTDNGSNYSVHNTDFIAGWHAFSLFNNKLFTSQVGNGMYQSDIQDVDFNLDNNGLPNTLNIFMIEEVIATENKLFAIAVEDLFSETTSLYYKTADNTSWTKIESVGTVSDINFLGKGTDNSIYIKLTEEVLDKSEEYSLYKINNELAITDISNLLSMPHDELVSIIGNDDDDLFVTYKYADADDTNKFRVYHSSDDGSTWTELIDPYANFIPVEVVSNISSDMPNPSLSFIDDDGNPVYMIRIDVATGLTYEHRFVRYDIDNSEWSQIPLAGLTSDVIFAAAFTQADGKYYIAMPYGLYTSSDLSTWTEEQYTGLLPGLIANSLIVSGNQLYMGTLANGLWTVELEVGVFTQNNDAIRIYPNPATDNLTLSNINQASSVKIIDTEGRVLFYTDDLRENLNVNLSGYAAGIYFVEITTDQKSIVKKIIVD